MTDYEIPSTAPTGVTHIKRLQIYVSGEREGPLEDLRFHIYGFEKEDQDGPGKDVGANAIDDYIGKFVDAAPELPLPLHRDPTQLDFPLQKPCCVVLKLIGKFWEFAPNPPSGQGQTIRTKNKHSDQRYRKLQQHFDTDGKLRAVSFYAQAIEPKATNARHGINLYVDFIEGRYRLPTLIDPDIENKGE
ncbi:nucleotide synthetase [Sphingomonas sp. ZT3P38]|uniref:nucleotide synthetase n=1 Tax=Parasphingomonas zepuensis TaxID=3096161 RepID=UPI002FC8D0FC